MAHMQSRVPTRKVMAGTLGAAVAQILIYVLELVVLPVPEAIAAAITTIVTFLLGYYIPPSDSDQVVPTMGGELQEGEERI